MVTKTLDELGPAECRRLLDAHHLGRLAFVHAPGEPPMITPVNYVFVDGAVVFRSDEGSKLRAALDRAGAAFEIDGVDHQEQVGWSVVVRGHVTVVTDPDEVARLQRVPLVTWAPARQPRYLRLSGDRITGRRVGVADLPSTWWG